MRARWFLIGVVLVSMCGLAPAGDQPAASGGSDVYVIPFSHLDLFWAGTREECLSRGNRVTARAVQIALQRPEFRFLLEEPDRSSDQETLQVKPYEISTVRLAVK